MKVINIQTKEYSESVLNKLKIFFTDFEIYQPKMVFCF